MIFFPTQLIRMIQQALLKMDDKDFTTYIYITPSMFAIINYINGEKLRDLNTLKLKDSKTAVRIFFSC